MSSKCSYASSIHLPRNGNLKASAHHSHLQVEIVHHIHSKLFTSASLALAISRLLVKVDQMTAIEFLEQHQRNQLVVRQWLQHFIAIHDAHTELEEAATPLRVRPVSEEESANVGALDCAASEILSILRAARSMPLKRS